MWQVRVVLRLCLKKWISFRDTGEKRLIGAGWRALSPDKRCGMPCFHSFCILSHAKFCPDFTESWSCKWGCLVLCVLYFFRIWSQLPSGHGKTEPQSLQNASCSQYGRCSRCNLLLCSADLWCERSHLPMTSFSVEARLMLKCDRV